MTEPTLRSLFCRKFFLFLLILIKMPPKKCCKNCNNPENAYVCFQKGVRVGFGLAKNPPLSRMTLRELGQQASRYKIKNYGQMTKAELIESLRTAGYTNQK